MKHPDTLNERYVNGVYTTYSYSINIFYMDITILLAEIWGPVMIAVGLGFFFSRPYYMQVYRDLEKDAFAVVFFGMFALASGIGHVLVHNAWDTFPQIVVSLFGWSLLVKGFVCTTFPGLADRGGDWALNSKMLPTVGSFVLLLGLYLTWVGYFM